MATLTKKQSVNLSEKEHQRFADTCTKLNAKPAQIMRALVLRYLAEKENIAVCKNKYCQQNNIAKENRCTILKDVLYCTKVVK